MEHSDRSPQQIFSLVEKGVDLVNKGVVNRDEAEQAKAIFDDVLSHDPSSTKALCGRGTAFRILEKSDEAIRDYDAAIELDPQYARAIFNRGLTQFQMRNVEEAFVDLNKAIEIEAEAGFFFHRSQCFCQLKRCDEAIIDLTTCVELWSSSRHGCFLHTHYKPTGSSRGSFGVTPWAD